MTENLAEAVEAVIRRRKTEKVLCHDTDVHNSVPVEVAEQHKKTVLDSIKTAGWAPFHYPRNEDKIAEPWRAHILWRDDALKVAQYMRDEIDNVKGEPALLAGCSAMVLVTWLPRYYGRDSQGVICQPSQKQSEIDIDEEHLAGASAMVQNLLLMLTAHGMGNYWSSGGKLRGQAMFEYLGIPSEERFLAAVFIEYPEMMDDSKERKPGKLRDKRSERWIRQVSI